MSETPRLTPVPDAPTPDTAADAAMETAPVETSESPAAGSAESGRPRRWPLVVLGLGLALVLALLVWSRVELARTTAALEGQIMDLEGEVHALGSQLRSREVVIDAQRERLGSVQDAVRSLQTLLDEPLPE